MRQEPDYVLTSAIRQRLDYCAFFHHTLSNMNRIMVLISVVKHGEAGAKPAEIIKEMGIKADIVSKSLSQLNKAMLVNFEESEQGIRIYKPTDTAMKWYRFENFGNPEDVVRLLNEREEMLDMDGRFSARQEEASVAGGPSGEILSSV